MEHKPWPKTPRWNRNLVISEKLDGTNSAVVVIDSSKDPLERVQCENSPFAWQTYEGFYVAAQSRTRFVSPQQDNAGFGKWVFDNRNMLALSLGVGTHHGEWWGQNLQRKYNQTRKNFSLFNISRYEGIDFDKDYNLPNVTVVPKLYEGPNSEAAIRTTLAMLESEGSVAAPGFMRPEGIILYHTASRSVYKILLEGDELPKSLHE